MENDDKTSPTGTEPQDPEDTEEEIEDGGRAIGGVVTVLVLPLALLGIVVLAWTVCDGFFSFFRCLAAELVLIPLMVAALLTLGSLRAVVLSLTSELQEIIVSAIVATLGLLATITLIWLFNLVAGDEISHRFHELLIALIRDAKRLFS